MKRPQFTLKTLLWLMAVVAVVLTAVAIHFQPAIETEHAVISEGSPLLPLACVVAGACVAVYLIRARR